MREGCSLGSLKLSKLITLLRLWCRLLTLNLLHVGHRLLHGLQHLSLHHQDLLKCWWWRWVVGSIIGIVLIGVAVVSVCHMVIMKRFETKMEIKNSQLYALRYNDD
jgi:hypothetical protein